jgi:hypothetical protein
MKYIWGYARLLAMFIFLSCDNSSGSSVPCTQEGGIYFAKHLEEECCDDLVPINLAFIPMDDYTGDDCPPGCGFDDYTPVDVMVCIACGDGVCGLKEQFCNCPADCPRPEDAGGDQ